MAAGDFEQAEFYLKKAIEVAVDPIYGLNARFCLSYVYFFQGKVALAAQTLETVIDATKKSGYEFVGTSAKAFYGIVSAAMGDMEKGIALVREQIGRQRKRGKRNHELIFTHMLGRFYLSLAQRKVPIGFTCAIRNTRFLLHALPAASRLAERYLREAVDIGTQIDARIRLAQAHLDLGRLRLHQKRFNDARSHIEQSIALFGCCDAPILLAEARTELDRFAL
jgi:tetratricopeptide (TPR) repeat protein